MVDEQELNKKLAEWAGFYDTGYVVIDNWRTPDGKRSLTVHELPNLSRSLDACFKWLVPKSERGNRYDYIHFGFDGALPEITTVQITFLDKLLATGEGEVPALALCLAIEELIDGGK